MRTSLDIVAFFTASLLARFAALLMAFHQRLIEQLEREVRLARDEVSGFVESHGYVSMEAEHFTRHRDRAGAAWQVIRGLGRHLPAIQDHPQACQLTYSLLRHVGSERFQSTKPIEWKTREEIL